MGFEGLFWYHTYVDEKKGVHRKNNGLRLLGTWIPGIEPVWAWRLLLLLGIVRSFFCDLEFLID